MVLPINPALSEQRIILHILIILLNQATAKLFQLITLSKQITPLECVIEIVPPPRAQRTKHKLILQAYAYGVLESPFRKSCSTIRTLH